MADVSDEDHVGNSLLQIWELKFCLKAKLLFQTLSTRFQGLVKILKLMFRQNFEEVTYLYISGIVTVPKQSEFNVNSYNKETVHFVNAKVLI